jgi:RHH-type proline utilization regulon transcriptional repressor/proline dehydrogenase/delta 1-pyrroline-5-carboxylate dehydrogenase
MADVTSHAITTGPRLFGARQNSRGWDLTDSADLANIEAAREPFALALFEAAPRLAGHVAGGLRLAIRNPATGAVVGHVVRSSSADVDTALRLAEPWIASPDIRAKVLHRAADLYEAEFGQVFALLAREAGKTLSDAVGELREAVDFLRYYADGATGLSADARGVFACISPWNFPLAIFTGQIAAALAAGNAVLAKPAEQTPLIAALAVDLLLKAGVPATALQQLPGDGTIGAALTRDARVKGVAFTGSTETALKIRSSMAEHLDPTAPLIAETGGLNAMLVDSTALPEQAVRDILASSFQSAGQRCSALRCLYVQADIAYTVEEMLFGAMDELALGDPWALQTDVGPVIDLDAQDGIRAYVAAARAEGRVIKELSAPDGCFVGPTVIRVDSIADMPREIFGPVLHIAHFPAGKVADVVRAVNATGYGLTFGLHTRIDDRVQSVVDALQVGNTYVNRNQIGAVVGSQPFGGEGLSGTGPKAGGPQYLARFTETKVKQVAGEDGRTDEAMVAAALRLDRDVGQSTAQVLPGPTGESNRLTSSPRPPVLCLGPTVAAALRQADLVRALGGHPVEAPGLEVEALSRLYGFSGAIWWGDAAGARVRARVLAARKGPILPLIGMPDSAHVRIERHVCIDTTASGGNAQLLAEVSGA